MSSTPQPAQQPLSVAFAESSLHGRRNAIAKRIDAPSAASPVARLPLLDAARGLAVGAMVIFHFSWTSGFRLHRIGCGGRSRLATFAHGIAGTFLFIVGVSLVLSTRNGPNARKIIHRLGALVAAALAITLVTLLIFPDSYIFFESSTASPSRACSGLSSSICRS